MGASASSHAIIVCTRCRDARTGALAGQQLLEKLANDGRFGGFVVATVDCMAGCDRPLSVAFRARDKASFLFGDIDPATDADSLAAFADLYRGLHDGWCNEGQRPAGLRGKTVARIPADGQVPS